MTERVIWRPYWDYEAEERWLNRMAAEGWEMKRYTWCRYVFERGEPGRYTYRLQLLPKVPSAAESQEYLRFLADAGVEVVSTHTRWVFVRRRTGSEPFELFSDRESKIGHHKQVATMLGVVATSQIPLVSVSIRNVIEHVRDSAYASLPLLAIHLVFVGIIGAVAMRQFSTVRRLERDAITHE